MRRSQNGNTDAKKLGVNTRKVEKQRLFVSDEMRRAAPRVLVE